MYRFRRQLSRRFPWVEDVIAFFVTRSPSALWQLTLQRRRKATEYANVLLSVLARNGREMSAPELKEAADVEVNYAIKIEWFYVIVFHLCREGLVEASTYEKEDLLYFRLTESGRRARIRRIISVSDVVGAWWGGIAPQPVGS